jgi:hypothetical protein
MPARLHPGVYVEEIPSPARSIEGVPTSTAVFVGETERGPLEPTKIRSRTEYTRLFGGYRRHANADAPLLTLPYSLDAFFQNGGSTAYILRAMTNPGGASRTFGASNAKVEASSPGAWGNNVSVVAHAASDDPNNQDLHRFRLTVLYQAPGATSKVVVEDWDRLSDDPANENYAKDVLKRSLYIRWAEDKAVVTPTFDTVPTKIEDIANANLNGGTGGDTDVTSFKDILSKLDEVSDASLLVVPAPVNTTITDDQRRSITDEALSYAENRRYMDLFCIADMPRLAKVDDPTSKAKDELGKINAKTNFGAAYFPWIEVSDPAGVGRDPTIVVPPSGFVAGLYARTDGRRGVWKAPAGVDATLLGIRRLEYKLLDAHQDELNPIGLNVLRVVPSAGSVVWGARTLQPNSEWRYIPVRRTAMFLRKSIYNGIQWAVFEPNDHDLWASLRLTIGSFMEQQFRQGAFAGKTAREAFFVKCDAETTPEADQIAGVVNVWVGFAPLRPAEFVVVKLSQIVNQKA